MTLDYNWGTAKVNITVNVLYNGEQKETFTVQDGASQGNNMAIRLNANQQNSFEIENVTMEPQNGVPITSATATEWDFSIWNEVGNQEQITITVTLCDKHVAMATPGGEISYEEGGYSFNRTYRIYDEQILKILHFNKVSVSKDTEIKGVEPVWVNSFGTPGTGSDKNFTEVNREHDYWNLEVVSDNAYLDEVQPGNIRKLIITYNNGGEDQTVDVYAKDLRCIRGSEAGYDHHYVIQLNHDDFHIVYFYNEEDLASSNNYTLYDVKFVDHGKSLDSDMPKDPTYNEVTTRYEFVAWTETYDGGMPFLSTTVVNEDTVVYAQKALSTITSASPWIHVMNNDNLLKERIAELYGVDVNDIDWDKLRIAVYGETDDIHTNPEYGNQGGLHNKWDSDAYEHFDILNFSTGAEGTDWENNPIHANDITKIGIYVVETDGTQLEGPKFIKKGLYDGDFAVSTGKGGSDALIELYINSDEYPDDPNAPEPEPEYTITGIDKELVGSAAAVPDGIDADDYTFPVNGTVLIPSGESVTLLYAITVTGEESATFSVTDDNATLVTGSVTGDNGTFTGSIPANGTITFYVSKTFEANDIDSDGYLTNNVTVDGTNDNEEDPDSNTDTETVPADEAYPVYTYVLFKGAGEKLTEAEKEQITETYGGEFEDGNDYLPIGHFLAPMPDPLDTNDEYTANENYKDSLLTDITPYMVNFKWLVDVHGNAFDLDEMEWINLSIAHGALAFDDALGDDCWHLDGKITLSDIPQTPDQVTITYHGNGGSFTNQWGTHTETNETGTYGSEITLYNTTYYFQREGYTNLGWSTTENGSVKFQGAEKVTLDDETFDGLSTSKHIDLYAVWEKNAPTFEELNALGLKVTIDCVSNVGHADGYVPLIKSTTNNPTCVIEKAQGTDTYTVSICDPNDYIAEYDKAAANGYTHTYVGFENDVKAFVVQWTGSEWTVTQGKVTILAKCMPEAPTEDALKALLDDAVKVQCVEESTHNCTFDVKDGYTVSGPTADGNGSWTYTVTVTADPYVADFNGKGKGEHWLVDSNAKTKDIVLTWNAADQTWAKPDQVVFDVTCKPTAPTYEIDVDVTNGTGTFFGAAVTTHILAMEGEDITIAFAPDAGYALDTVAVDGQPAVLAADGTYTFEKVDADHSITVVYATDAWNDKDDTTTGGDGIPDYKQVLIAYTTDGSGTVSPTTQVETLEVNADGKYVGTVNVGSTATANEGYAFAFWMGPNDSTFWSKVLNTTLTVEGGKTYTYTATFGTDLIGPEDPTGEDPDKPGDGIPDKYQVVVKYVANKGGKITGKQVEVLTIYDADGHYSIVGDVTATGSQAAAFHNWDFSRWVAPNGGVADWNPTLGQQTIEDAEGGKTYVFTAHFRYDPYIPPVVDPDPDDPTPPPVNPNPPQLNTEDHYAYIVGYEDGTVRPEGDITRAEVATIFFRLLTDESRNEYWSQTNDYTDVAEGDWYNNAVSTLSKAGILNGYEDGSFQPNGNITRAEFATIAARFFEATYEGEDLFPDIEDHWARDYINQAAHAGIVNGYEDGTFRPQDNITRAEAMTIVNRTLDRHPDADHFLDNMVTWPDNLESAWYYEQVQEATNSHEYVMKTDADKNPYEIWKEILPVRDWSELEKTWSEAHAG